MKTKFIALFFLAATIFLQAQVGINTETPSTTLQIKGKDVANKVEGVLIPKYTGDEIFNMPISTAQGFTATSTANEANLVYATSAASTANQNKLGRGEFLTTSGFFYWDHPGQKWRRFFVATSTANGNDGVVRIDGQNGSTTDKPRWNNIADTSFGNFPPPNPIPSNYQAQKITYAGTLAYNAAATHWPENNVAPYQDSYIYNSSTGKFLENGIDGQVHFWRVIVKINSNSVSSAAIVCYLYNPLSGFVTSSTQVVAAGTSASEATVTFTFITVADSNSINYGYEFWIDANKKLNWMEVQSIARVSLFKD